MSRFRTGPRDGRSPGKQSHCRQLPSAANAGRFAALGLLGLLVSCGPSPDSRSPSGSDTLAAEATVLARVGDRVITVDRFEEEWKRRQGAALSGNRPVGEARRRLLEEMIQFEVLLARARESGLDRDPEFRDRMDRLLVAFYQDRHLAGPEPADSAITETEVQAWYETHPERYLTPAATRWAVLLLKASPKAQPAQRAERRALAAQLRQKALEAGGDEFARLAQRHSEDQASRYAGGDIGWIQSGDAVPGWRAVLPDFATKVDATSGLTPVIELPDGFLLARVIERRPASRPPLAEVRDGIRHWLARSKEERRRTEQLKELRRGLRIEVHETLLQSLPAPPAIGDPGLPSSPAG